MSLHFLHVFGGVLKFWSDSWKPLMDVGTVGHLLTRNTQGNLGLACTNHSPSHFAAFELHGSIMQTSKALIYLKTERAQVETEERHVCLCGFLVF